MSSGGTSCQGQSPWPQLCPKFSEDSSMSTPLLLLGRGEPVSRTSSHPASDSLFTSGWKSTEDRERKKEHLALDTG